MTPTLKATLGQARGRRVTVRNNITSPTRQRSADVFMEEDDESRGSSSTITRLVLSNLPYHDPKVLLNNSGS